MVAQYITVSGAYGRKYNSIKQAKQDWADGMDFFIRTIGQHSYINKDDLQPGMVIMCRYHNDEKIAELARSK